MLQVYSVDCHLEGQLLSRFRFLDVQLTQYVVVLDGQLTQ